jgi:hypothetical protein
VSDSLTSRTLPSAVAGLVGTATVLALLYFGRDVLIPITLAFILSFLIAPFVRAAPSRPRADDIGLHRRAGGDRDAAGDRRVIVQQVGMMGASLPSIRTPSPPRSKRWIS